MSAESLPRSRTPRVPHMTDFPAYYITHKRKVNSDIYRETPIGADGTGGIIIPRAIRMIRGTPRMVPDELRIDPGTGQKNRPAVSMYGSRAFIYCSFAFRAFAIPAIFPCVRRMHASCAAHHVTMIFPQE